MTSFLKVNPSKTRPFPFKTVVIWVPGIYMNLTAIFCWKGVPQAHHPNFGLSTPLMGFTCQGSHPNETTRVCWASKGLVFKKDAQGGDLTLPLFSVETYSMRLAIIPCIQSKVNHVFCLLIRNYQFRLMFFFNFPIHEIAHATAASSGWYPPVSIGHASFLKCCHHPCFNLHCVMFCLPCNWSRSVIQLFIQKSAAISEAPKNRVSSYLPPSILASVV